MSRKIWCGIAAALLLCISPAAAFDRVVHYDVVYAVAIANGFSKDDAALIARASQSLDDNVSTTAYDEGLVGRERKDVLAGRVALDDLQHMKSGQIFHALTTQRAEVEEAHIKRIEEALHDPAVTQSRRLLYLGEYLHFVADEVVHPTNPLIGHFLEGHEPDRADMNSQSLRVAIAVLGDKMRQYRADESAGESASPSLSVTPPQSFSQVPRRLAEDDTANVMLEKVAVAVSDSWSKTYPYEAGCNGRLDCATKYARDAGEEFVENQTGVSVAAVKRVADVYSERLDGARQARAASEIARVLQQNGYEYQTYKAETSDMRPFQKIPLDKNGEPIGDRDGIFGDAPQGSDPSFAITAAASPELKQEREQVTLTQVFRAASGEATDAVLKETGLSATQDVMDAERKAAAWVPPSSPGGIALNPNLDLPDDLGTPLRIEGDDGGLYLQTDKGRFLFEGVSVRSFATVVRTVANGEIPYLSIGSEPSDRPGYAKVTYAPSLRGTTEGHVLYDADIQFKTIFAKLPLTRAQEEKGLKPLLAGFPGYGADFVRFWITSRDIRLARTGEQLITVDPGMRINSETRLHFATRSDPEMEAYVDNLSAHWDQIAESLPQFREVQRLALTTAIVFWARDRHVPVDPTILLEPPETDLTPAYAPIVGAFDGELVVAGGVSLTPEDRQTDIGRGFLSFIAARNDRDEAAFGARMARLILAGEGLTLVVLALLLPALLLWSLTKHRGLSMLKALKVWGGLCAIEIVAVALVLPFVLGGGLSFFDQDLLALMVTVGLFPALLFVVLRRAAPLTGWRRRALLALGLCGPVVAGCFGIGLAELTVAVTGPVPSITLDRVLTAEISPLEIFGRAFFTRSIPPGATVGTLLPVPQSLLETFRPEFELHRISVQPDEQINLDGHDPNLPVQSLKRVHWSKDRSVEGGVSHYTTDGSPPF